VLAEKYVNKRAYKAWLLGPAGRRSGTGYQRSMLISVPTKRDFLAQRADAPVRDTNADRLVRLAPMWLKQWQIV